MEFRFLVKRAGYLSAAKVWYLDGELLSGVIPDSKMVSALTIDGSVPVFIKNVALVGIKNYDDKTFTLSIHKPDCNLKLFEGAVLIDQDSDHHQKESLQLLVEST